MGTVETMKLVAEQRGQTGTGKVRRLRHAGWMPCVIYNENGESRPVQVNRHAFEMLIRRRRSENVIMDLDIKDDKIRKVFVKEVQRHVVNGESLHADFLEVSMTRKMRVGIPIKLVGEPVGVTAGGVLDQPMRELEVECLPGDMVEFLTVDVSGLAIGQTVTVGQMTVDPKLHVLAAATQAVASVLAPMAEEEVAPEAAVAEGTEPELIKKPVKEGEEGEGAAADEKGAKASPEKGGKAPAEKAGAKPEKADKAAKPEKKESKSKG
jgi:large subunit ribosomal protein L25